MTSTLYRKGRQFETCMARRMLNALHETPSKSCSLATELRRKKNLGRAALPHSPVALIQDMTQPRYLTWTTVTTLMAWATRGSKSRQDNLQKHAYRYAPAIFNIPTPSVASVVSKGYEPRSVGSVVSSSQGATEAPPQIWFFCAR